MSLIKKIQKLLGAKTKQPDPAPQSSPDDTHAYPITKRIKTWLDGHDWKYDHRFPDDDDDGVHHLIMGFSDAENEWTCVFKIHERTQLVTVFGILEDAVPMTHYAPVLVALSRINTRVIFGSVNLDASDGEVRAKVSFDAEFGVVDERSLGCYMQAVAGLTDIMRQAVKDALEEREPSQMVSNYLQVDDEIRTVIDDEKQTFFVPTQTAQ